MPRTRSRHMVVWVVIVVVVVLIVAFAVFRGGSSTDRPAARRGGGAQGPVPVTVVAVEQENVPVYLTATGTVQALETVNVQPQVGGRLLSVDFKEGQAVTKGQVLAQIDPRTYQATYDQAVARVNSDKAQLATARSNLAQSQQLIKHHYISEQDLTTQANTVKQLQATVAADEANAQSARINLGYTKVRAPITGLTGIRNVDRGNVLTTGSVIVTLTHVHPINVIFSLPGKDLDQVRAAQADAPLAVAAMDRTDDHVLEGDGVLKVINNQIDPDSGTFTLKSQFPNSETQLWPGQFVNVRMRLGTVHNGLVIPTQALERGPDGDYVYVLTRDNTVKMQPVTTGANADETHVLVSKGLNAGDQVVTEGQFRLKPGSKVKPFKPGQVAVAAPASVATPAATQRPARGAAK